MKVLTFILLALIFSSGFAATLEFDLNIKHKKNSITKNTSSQVQVKLGEPFTIKTRDMEVILTATEEGMKSFSGNSKSAISFKGKIYDLEKGKRKLISSPQVVASLDSAVDLITKDNLGNELQLNIQTLSLID